MDHEEIGCIERIASAYGVAVVYAKSDTQWYDEIRDPDVSVAASDFAALDLSKERVIVHRDHADFAVVLHEIVHVVVQPPHLSIFEVPEDFALLAFERELATEFAPDNLHEVVEYQLVTDVPLLARECDLRSSNGCAAFLEEFAYYEKSRTWKRAYRNAIDLDLLDRNHRPTMRRPSWTPTLRRRVKCASRRARGLA